MAGMRKTIIGRGLGRIRDYAENGTVLLLLVLSCAAWGFLELGEAVSDGGTHSFDQRILLLMRSATDAGDPVGPPWFEEMSRDVTALGGVGVLAFLTLATGGLLGLSGRWRTMWFVFLAVGGGLVLSSLAKAGFDRPRPDLVPQFSLVHTSSFPSGHSMMAAVTYLTLAALLARSQPQRRIKIYLILLAALVTVAVGLSRIYLGVHWPTDVVAGWTAGAAWALLCLLAARLLEQRRAIEPEPPERD